MYDRVSGGMLAAGLVTREPRRREQRYPQTNTNVSAHCMGELRAAVAGHHVPSPPVLALAGLVALLSLERVFGFNVPATEVRNRLNVLIGYCSSAVRDVLTHAGALIGDTAMSAYR